MLGFAVAEEDFPWHKIGIYRTFWNESIVLHRHSFVLG